MIMIRRLNLAVVSGKGGVGKTSITASLACEMKARGINILTADADVDAPNLEILFQTDGKVVDDFKVKTTEKALFVEENCIHCKLCITEQFCNYGAIRWDEENQIPIIDPISCEGCRACKYLCPQSAFEIEQVESGTIKHLESQYNFSVITGETILGAQTSGKLVTEMKSYAKKIADEQNSEIVLIDGPPGIGCPVIATLADMDYTIVVIEPTAAALHDAKRVMNVIRGFGNSFGVVINKSDMWDKAREEIIEFLKENGIDLLGAIKIDKDWPYAIAKGLPILEYKPEGPSAESIKQITNNLLEIIKNIE